MSFEKVKTFRAGPLPLPLSSFSLLNWRPAAIVVAVFMPPLSLGLQVGEDISAEKIRIQIKARVNYFLGCKEDTLEKSLAHAFVYGKAQWWSRALDEMIDANAYVEAKAREDSYVDLEVHATILHNLGSTLHQLSYFEAALHFYSAALEKMRRAPKSLVWKCVPCLDHRGRQVEYMQDRANDCKAKRKNDGKEYFTVWGRRQFTPGEVAKAVVEVGD